MRYLPVPRMRYLPVPHTGFLYIFCIDLGTILACYIIIRFYQSYLDKSC